MKYMDIIKKVDMFIEVMKVCLTKRPGPVNYSLN